MAAAVLWAASPGCRPGGGAARASGPRVLIDAAAGTAAVRVEVARSPAQREHGLMDRPVLDADAGMIFLFEEAAPHAFWMKNTLIPLDLVFIGDDGRVAAIVGRQPLSHEASDGGVASRYVLEVNLGWARSHGVKPGDPVRFENVLF